MRTAKDKYLGTIYFNNYGTPMLIVDYKNGGNIIIEFQDEHKVRKQTNMSHILSGDIINPYDKRVQGVGYIGEGKYSKKNDIECYNHWSNMLLRCYNAQYKKEHPSYKDATCCEEWLNFQCFAEWYYNNFYYIDTDRMELDKDIIIKNNKLYSPDSCVLVPQKINLLFIKNQKKRGKYPIGVDFHKGKYRARCNTIDGSVFLGNYNNPKSAFLAYKNFKEKYLKEVAEKYKNYIPNVLYEALYNYEVDEGD